MKKSIRFNTLTKKFLSPTCINYRPVISAMTCHGNFREDISANIVNFFVLTAINWIKIEDICYLVYHTSYNSFIPKPK